MHGAEAYFHPLGFLTRLTLAVIFSAFLADAAAAQNKGAAATRHAIVIANNNYTHMTPLRGAINDGRAISNALASFGFRTTLLEDATAQQIGERIDVLLRTISKQEVLLVYFAGNGFQFEGNHYFLGIDAEARGRASLPFETVQLEGLVDIIDNGERTVLLFWDTCRIEHKFARSDAAKTPAGPTRFETSGEMLIAFGSSPGQEAFEIGSHGAFTSALLKHMETPDLEIEDLLQRVAVDVDQATKGKQTPQRLSQLKREFYFKRSGDAASAQGIDVYSAQKRFDLTLAGDVPEGVRANADVKLNGKDYKVSNVDSGTRTIQFLGNEDDVLLKGVNLLETEVRQFKFWNEERVLSAFDDPYPKSYAIIAAIDDYDRVNDPQQRGATGYRHLTDMVTRANELKKTLIATGFPEANIITLYDDQATRPALEDALGEFWEGGKHADADRLLFYFGGHGSGTAGGGFLVTYDIDPKRQTRTGFLMSKFLSEQFPNLKPRQVLVALDSCSSGLALAGTKTLDGGASQQDLERFATMAAIRADAYESARNILVAGTGEQKAMWETGGIFTQALIEGISGRADYVQDGVVQFDELSMFIDRQVTAKAAAVGVRQDPRPFVATGFGPGKVLFMTPTR